MIRYFGSNLPESSLICGRIAASESLSGQTGILSPETAPVGDGSRQPAWNLRPKRVGIRGFSAGGHLASIAGTHFDAGDTQAADPIERESCRPDVTVLIYPVVTTGDTTHSGSKSRVSLREKAFISAKHAAWRDRPFLPLCSFHGRRNEAAVELRKKETE